MYDFRTLKLNRSYLWAGIFTLLIGLWLLSGIISRSVQEPADKTAQATPQSKIFRVRVQKLTARPHGAVIVIRGRTQASRKIEARAQTAGLVSKVPHGEGSRVKAGDMLCELELSTRAIKLAEARAKLAQAELDLDAASRLEIQKFVSKTKRAETQAKFDAARAGVALMQKEIDYTRIRASQAGTIEKRPAEPGSFLQIGGLCAIVTVLHPIRVIGTVSEREIPHLHEGMKGQARLITGEKVAGVVRFVSPTADTNTRTFRIELEVPNKDFKLRDGLTAELTIPLPSQQAHLISPANLTLSDNGDIGVKTVDENSIARFNKVTILADGKQGVWIAGLPEKITLITVGQEFVLDGQKVATVEVPVKTSTKMQKDMAPGDATK